MARKKQLHTNKQQAVINQLKTLVVNQGRQISDLYKGMLGFQGQEGFDYETLACKNGFPTNPTFADWYKQYINNGYATSACDSPVNLCWVTKPKIQDVTKFEDNGDPLDVADNSQFTKAIEELLSDRKLKFWVRVVELDRRQRVGRYAGMLMVYHDIAPANMPLTHGSKLACMIPFYEGQLYPIEFDSNENSIYYGMPTHYQINEANLADNAVQQPRSMIVHASRVFIAAEGAGDGTIYGVSTLGSCFNATIIAQRTSFSACSGLERHNLQRAIMSIMEGAQLPPAGSELREIMDENIDDFDAGLLSMLEVAGANVTPFNGTFHDPSKVHSLATAEITAATGVPESILSRRSIAMAAGEADLESYRIDMQSRRENFCSEMLLDLIGRMIDEGTLPKPDGQVYIKWDDLTEPSLRDKLEMREKMAKTNAEQVKCGEPPVYTSEQIFYLKVDGKFVAPDEDLGGEEDV